MATLTGAVIAAAILAGVAAVPMVLPSLRDAGVWICAVAVMAAGFSLLMQRGAGPDLAVATYFGAGALGPAIALAWGMAPLTALAFGVALAALGSAALAAVTLRIGRGHGRETQALVSLIVAVVAVKLAAGVGPATLAVPMPLPTTPEIVGAVVPPGQGAIPATIAPMLGGVEAPAPERLARDGQGLVYLGIVGATALALLTLGAVSAWSGRAAAVMPASLAMAATAALAGGMRAVWQGDVAPVEVLAPDVLLLTAVVAVIAGPGSVRRALVAAALVVPAGLWAAAAADVVTASLPTIAGPGVAMAWLGGLLILALAARAR